MTANKVAARHDLMFRRTNRDGFRWAKRSKECSESPTTTRQQNAGDALKVIQNVLPEVHESVPLKKAIASAGKNHIGTTRDLQSFFPQFEESF